MACVDESVTSPSSIGYCVCIDLAHVLLNLPRVFFVVYSVIVVTFQSVLQLLIMKGRQKWQNSYERSIGCLVVSAAVTTFWTICFFIGNMLSKFPSHCHSLCETPQRTNPFASSTDASIYVVIAYVVLTLVPAFVVTVATSVWAFIIFKKKFMAASEKDTAFSRRMFLLPVMMVILLICNSLLSYLITVVTERGLNKESLGPFSGNWANLLSAFFYFVLDILHALSYPLVLLFLYSRLRKIWKNMFSCKERFSDSSHKNHSKLPIESNSDQ